MEPEPLTDAQRALTQASEYLAREVARWRKWGTWLPYEDRLGVAFRGLATAARDYNPQIGPFPPFAISRMVGYIYHALRDESKGRLIVSVREARAYFENRLPPDQAAGFIHRHQVAQLDHCLGSGSIADRLRAPGDLPGEALLRGVQAELLWEKINALPPPQPEILRLRHVELLTQREVGERLGKAANHISRIERRAIRVLRGQLAGKL